MAIVDSGPINVKVSLEQAIALLVREHGLEELVRQLFKEELVRQLKQRAQQEAIERSEGE